MKAYLLLLTSAISAMVAMSSATDITKKPFRERSIAVSALAEELGEVIDNAVDTNQTR